MIRAATAAVAVLLLAGCGGEDGPSKEDFTKRANAICADLNRALAPLNAESAKAQTSSDEAKVFRGLADVTKRSVATTEPFLGKLDALAAPGDDRDRLKTWIADGRRRLALMTELSHAFAAKDQAEIVRVSEQIDELATRTNRFATSYGMPACGQRR